MEKIVECVINISEGRDNTVLRQLAAVAGSHPEAFLLNLSSDPDHNRAVFTIAGSPQGVLEASWECSRKALSILDIRLHQGIHPRIGIVDVVPFVPLLNTSMEECSELARVLGRRLGSRLHVPVFLYGHAARAPERIELSSIRRGGTAGAAARMKTHPPDFGPSRLHLTAGASAVGAREILIAFNIDLAGRSLDTAAEIAGLTRESSGGLPSVKALGLYLRERDCTQVSMNLTDYRRTSIIQVFEHVARLADRHGIQVAGSEVIGLIPRDSLAESDAGLIKIRNFIPSDIYIEDCLAKALR